MRSALRIFILALTLAGLMGCSTTRDPGFPRPGSSNWQTLNQLQAPPCSFPVWVEGSRRIAREAPVGFRVVSARNGRLWILQVDSRDRFSLLYPNPWARNNRIISHSPVLIPEPGSSWGLSSGPFPGRSVLVFVVTTDKTDLEALAHKTGEAGYFCHSLKQLSRWGLARLVVEVD